MSDEKTTKERILETMLILIGEDGLQKITVRHLAEKAGVNVAAINYHFGSKEKLVETALAFFGTKLESTFLMLESADMDDKEKIKGAVKNFFTLLAAYPGFIKSLLFYSMKKKNLKTLPYTQVKRGQELLIKVLKRIYNTSSEEEVRIKLFQLISALVLPSLLEDFTVPLYDIDLSTGETREAYVDLLLETYLQ